jgi:hypothetical protein
MTGEAPTKLLHSDEVFRVQGAVFEVNRLMGAGFLEAVYQESWRLSSQPEEYRLSRARLCHCPTKVRA